MAIFHTDGTMGLDEGPAGPVSGALHGIGGGKSSGGGEGSHTARLGIEASLRASQAQQRS